MSSARFSTVFHLNEGLVDQHTTNDVEGTNARCTADRSDGIVLCRQKIFSNRFALNGVKEVVGHER